MPMALSRLDGATLWTTKPALDGHPIRVVVEPTPDGRWDWAVWQDGRGASCRHGVSRARTCAIGAAETAARDLELRALRRPAW